MFQNEMFVLILTEQEEFDTWLDVFTPSKIRQKKTLLRLLLISCHVLVVLRFLKWWNHLQQTGKGTVFPLKVLSSWNTLFLLLRQGALIVCSFQRFKKIKKERSREWDMWALNSNWPTKGLNWSSPKHQSRHLCSVSKHMHVVKRQTGGFKLISGDPGAVTDWHLKEGLVI